MSKEFGTITLWDEDDNELELGIFDSTTIAGITYLLVIDEEEDSLILLKVAEESDDGEYMDYIVVEDDDEIDSIMKVFKEMNEDFDLVW